MMLQVMEVTQQSSEKELASSTEKLNIGSIFSCLALISRAAVSAAQPIVLGASASHSAAMTSHQKASGGQNGPHKAERKSSVSSFGFNTG